MITGMVICFPLCLTLACPLIIYNTLYPNPNPNNTVHSVWTITEIAYSGSIFTQGINFWSLTKIFKVSNPLISEKISSISSTFTPLCLPHLSPPTTQQSHLTFAALADGADGMFAVLPEVKTWSGAQAYCRLHAADLASARSPAENEAVRQLIGQQEEESHPLFWIGLFKSKVRSSDGAYSSFHNWYRTQPNKDGWCVLATSLGKWYDRGCANKLMCFYCYGK